MYKATITVFLCIITLNRYLIANNNDLRIVSRIKWCAKPPKAIEYMKKPVPFVVIHHSAIPLACTTQEKCIQAMRSMQTYHQETQGWNDIGYNFAVGGDFRVYEGRGWSVVGAHAPSYNNKSIGICIIGDWSDELPPEEQLTLVKNLIDYGVRLGEISLDYKLVGHRQVRNGTVCPGDALFNEIKTWEHFENFPDNVNATYKPEKLTTKYMSKEEAKKTFNQINKKLWKRE